MCLSTVLGITFQRGGPIWGSQSDLNHNVCMGTGVELYLKSSLRYSCLWVKIQICTKGWKRWQIQHHVRCQTSVAMYMHRPSGLQQGMQASSWLTSNFVGSEDLLLVIMPEHRLGYANYQGTSRAQSQVVLTISSLFGLSIDMRSLDQIWLDHCLLSPA